MKAIIHVFLLSILSNLICFNAASFSMHAEMMKLIENKPLNDKFRFWHFAMQKTYDLNSSEGQKRLHIFEENLKYIEKRNSEQSETILGLGPFTDISNEEYIENLFGSRKNEIREETINFDEMADLPEFSEPDTKADQDFIIDWSSIFSGYKVRKSVCNTDYLLNALASLLEAHVAINEKKAKIDKRLSIQQFANCVSANDYCKREGLPYEYLTFAYHMGIPSEETVPTINKQDECNYKAKASIQTMGLEYCLAGEDKPVQVKCTTEKYQNALKEGPFITSIDVRSKDFQNYQGGVLNLVDCNAKYYGLSVIVIGMNNTELTFLNSMDSKWGVNGIGKIKRTETSCGLLEKMYKPEVVHSIK